MLTTAAKFKKYALIAALTALPAVLTAGTDREAYLNATPEERAEIRERMNARRQAANIARFDEDGTGDLSPEERAKAAEVLRAEWEETQARRAAAVAERRQQVQDTRTALMLPRFDTNRDGQLSEAERAQAEASIRREQDAHRANR